MTWGPRPTVNSAPRSMALEIILTSSAMSPDSYGKKLSPGNNSPSTQDHSNRQTDAGEGSSATFCRTAINGAEHN